MSRRKQSNARVLAEECARPLVWAVQVRSMVEGQPRGEWTTAAGRWTTHAEAVMGMARLAARCDMSAFRVVQVSQ